MMRTRNDHQQRKETVLGLVVNEYIKTVNPVSSAHIKREYFLDLSPATIRNILAELEQDGFLTHPHTSAGRVPTADGYRFYVDNLMNEIQLLEEEKRRIKAQYEQKRRDLEELLDNTSRVLADTTHYTGIVSLDGWTGQFVCKGTGYVVEYLDDHDLTQVGEILRALEEKEQILQILNRDIAARIQIYIGQELALREVDRCALAVSPYRTESGHSGRIAVLGPTRMDYQRVVSTLEYLSQLMPQLI